MSSDITFRVWESAQSYDDLYDMVREWGEKLGTTVNLVSDDEGVRFIDPNSGRELASGVMEWDEKQLASFLKKIGAASIILKDRIGSLRPGEYSVKAISKRLVEPKQGQTFRIVQGRPVGKEQW
jgi:hypothetical protein